MKKGTCCGIFSKLTKEERIEAIEMLIKNFNGFDEVDLIVSELDLVDPLQMFLKKMTKTRMKLKFSLRMRLRVILDNTLLEKMLEKLNLLAIFSCEKCNKQLGSRRSYEYHVKRYHN